MNDTAQRPSFMSRCRQFRLAMPRNLSAQAKRIAEILFSYADDDGSGIFVGIAKLAHEAGEPERTVSRAIAELTDADYLIDDGWRWHGASTKTRQRRLDLPRMMADRAFQDDARNGEQPPGGTLPDLAKDTARNGGSTLPGMADSPPKHPARNGEQPMSSKKLTQEESTRECTHRAQAREACPTVLDAWNAMAKNHGLSAAQTITPSRRAAIGARIRDHGLDGVLKAIRAVGESEFCRGEVNGWKANFDFVLQARSCTKLIEGAYQGTHGRGRTDNQTELLRSLGWTASQMAERENYIDGEIVR